MEGVETITARRVYHYRVGCHEFQGGGVLCGTVFVFLTLVLESCDCVCVSQVVMIKGETALDMRGRCSAGQKVWWLM